MIHRTGIWERATDNGVNSNDFFKAVKEDKLNSLQDVDIVFKKQIAKYKKEQKKQNKIPQSQRETPKKQQTTTLLSSLNPTISQPSVKPPFRSPPRKKQRQQPSSPITSRINENNPGNYISWINKYQIQQSQQDKSRKEKPQKNTSKDDAKVNYFIFFHVFLSFLFSSFLFFFWIFLCFSNVIFKTKKNRY